MNQEPGAQRYFKEYAENFVSSYDAPRWHILRRLKVELWRDLHERENLALKLTMPLTGKSVLDVGCGDGRYAPRFVQLGVKSYLGIDFSDEMIRRAQPITQKFTNCSFKQMSFDDFSKNETFDHVIAMGVLDYIKNPVEFLTKAIELSNESVVVSFPRHTFLRGNARIIRYSLRGCKIWLYSMEKLLTVLNQLPNAASYRIVQIPGYGMDTVVQIFKRI